MSRHPVPPAALANRSAAPCDIFTLTDSIGAGALATSIGTRWVARLRNDLRARHPVPSLAGGEGYRPARWAVGTGPMLMPQPFAVTGPPATINAVFS